MGLSYLLEFFRLIQRSVKFLSCINFDMKFLVLLHNRMFETHQLSLVRLFHVFFPRILHLQPFFESVGFFLTLFLLQIREFLRQRLLTETCNQTNMVRLLNAAEFR